MKALQAVQQHGLVDLLHDVDPHLNDVVWTHAENVAVKGCAMQFAERQSVRHTPFARRLGIGDDVGRFEQLVMA